MITANRATPDTMGEILSDIESEGVQATQIIDRHRTMLRSHPLDRKPIDLHAVISESLALVAHDMKARQIEAIVNLSSDPCIIDGDQVLLQQVLVNLVINAMDAMAETPPARRRITISTEVRTADVEVSVREITQVNPEAKLIVFSATNDPDVRQRSSRSAHLPLYPRAMPACSRPSNACVVTGLMPVGRPSKTAVSDLILLDYSPHREVPLQVGDRLNVG